MMANAVNVQITEDGDRNVIAKIDVEADTSDITDAVLLDPAALNPTRPPTDLLAVEEIQFSVQDGWNVLLNWDATTKVRIVNLDGRGRFPLEKLEPITNNAGVGRTGKILLSTTGYSSGTMLATIVLYCIKQTDPADFGPQSNAPLQTEAGQNILTELGQLILTE